MKEFGPKDKFPPKILSAIARHFCRSCPSRKKDDSPYSNGKVCYDKNFPGNQNCQTLMVLESLTPELLQKSLNKTNNTE